ncbi:MAG: hypothetical protein R6V27_07495 [Balneolaceae bacterium]
MTILLFWISLITSAFMTGLIWTVQLVHYPSFHAFEKNQFAKHMDFHRTRISYIVLPVMLLELASSVSLAAMSTNFRSEFIIALAVLIIIWASTFFLQVPAHGAIAQTYDRDVVKKLVATNWIRTLCWTFRTSILLYVLSKLSLLGLF